MRRTRALILLAAASLGLAACRVDTTLIVRVDGSGSGEVAVRVHLDPSAVRAAEVDGRRLADAVRIADLADAGWTVRGWRRNDRGATLTVAKPFRDPEQVPAIVAEITGTVPVVRAVEVTHRAGGLRDAYGVRIDLDPGALRSGLAEDPALAARVRAAGVDPAAAAAALDRAIASSVRVGAVADLPGAAPVRGTPSDGRIVVDTASTVWHPAQVLLAIVGVALLIASIVVVFASVRAHRRRPRGRHSQRAPRHAPQQREEDPTLRLPKGSHGAHAPSRRHRRHASDD